jgi:ATP sulfurylase
MERSGCDGLFIHPAVGKKKKGDYTAEAIIQSYEIMMGKHYPRNRVVFGIFSTYSRYAGPREAIFTALCRKNFGCSHFIVGRDHTGVGQFYDPIASQKIFDQFDDLGIDPIFFGEIGFSKKLNRYASVEEFDRQDLLNISGTEAREMLKRNLVPPEWFMRPDISQFIIDKLSKNEDVFVS